MIAHIVILLCNFAPRPSSPACHSSFYFVLFKSVLLTRHERVMLFTLGVGTLATLSSVLALRNCILCAILFLAPVVRAASIPVRSGLMLGVLPAPPPPFLLSHYSISSSTPCPLTALRRCPFVLLPPGSAPCFEPPPPSTSFIPMRSSGHSL